MNNQVSVIRINYAALLPQEEIFLRKAEELLNFLSLTITTKKSDCIVLLMRSEGAAVTPAVSWEDGSKGFLNTILADLFF
jgi:hypothetical protein